VIHRALFTKAMIVRHGAENQNPMDVVWHHDECIDLNRRES